VEEGGSFVESEGKRKAIALVDGNGGSVVRLESRFGMGEMEELGVVEGARRAVMSMEGSARVEPEAIGSDAGTREDERRSTDGGSVLPLSERNTSTNRPVSTSQVSSMTLSSTPPAHATITHFPPPIEG
jgi:hypothetical protein